ncbi:MAG: hypothetical protein NC918_00285 [Candidatus Omnitrophica bacterium]|nr:hypothetical protein [Candidatus Omnitrophota bacterium]
MYIIKLSDLKGEKLFFYPINKPRQRLTNKIEIQNVFFVGKKYDNFIVQDGIKRFRRTLFYQFFSSKNLSQLENKIQSIKTKLEQKKQGPSIVFSELFEYPGYSFKDLAYDFKILDKDITFCLITSETSYINKPLSLITNLNKDVDYVFQYGGDLGVFSTILNFFEDLFNYPYDDERLILIVEDKPSHYTRILNTLNHEVSKGRTRNILARDYEEAKKIILDCPSRLAAAILDFCFVKDGNYGEYSWDVLNTFESRNIKIPVIFTSENKEIISKIKQDSRIFALNKASYGFLKNMRSILGKYGGFGPFVFRTPPPNEQDVATSYSLNNLMEVIKAIDDKILLNHSKDNHFSNWIWLQGYKKLALKIRDIVSEDPAYIRKSILHYYHESKKENK